MCKCGSEYNGVTLGLESGYYPIRRSEVFNSVFDIDKLLKSGRANNGLGDIYNLWNPSDECGKGLPEYIGDFYQNFNSMVQGVDGATYGNLEILLRRALYFRYCKCKDCPPEQQDTSGVPIVPPNTRLSRPPLGVSTKLYRSAVAVTCCGRGYAASFTVNSKQRNVNGIRTSREEVAFTFNSGFAIYWRTKINTISASPLRQSMQHEIFIVGSISGGGTEYLNGRTQSDFFYEYNFRRRIDFNFWKNSNGNVPSNYSYDICGSNPAYVNQIRSVVFFSTELGSIYENDYEVKISNITVTTLQGNPITDDCADGSSGYPQPPPEPEPRIDYYDFDCGAPPAMPKSKPLSPEWVSYIENCTGKDIEEPDTITIIYLDGINGIDGINGSNGSAGINGVNGTMGLRGFNGTDGRDGRDGRDGIDGINGINGSNGSNGTNGTDGINGSNGSNGSNGINGTGSGGGSEPTSIMLTALPPILGQPSSLTLSGGDNAYTLIWRQEKVDFALLLARLDRITSALIFPAEQVGREDRLLETSETSGDLAGFLSILSDNLTRLERTIYPIPSTTGYFEEITKGTRKSVDEYFLSMEVNIVASPLGLSQIFSRNPAVQNLSDYGFLVWEIQGLPDDLNMVRLRSRASMHRKPDLCTGFFVYPLAGVVIEIVYYNTQDLDRL